MKQAMQRMRQSILRCTGPVFLKVRMYLQAKEERPALFLFSINVVLVFLLIFQFNIGGLFAVGYEGASRLFDVEQEELQSIDIHDPDFQGAKLRLVRQAVLPRPQWHVDSAKTAGTFSFFSRTPIQYQWQLEVSKEGEETKSYPADIENTAEFFDSIRNARRYYSVASSPEKDKLFGMQIDSKGQYAGLLLKFKMMNNTENTLYVGRSTKGGKQTYLRFNDEKEIYLVSSDLRVKSGSGDLDYFRNHTILPPYLRSARIVSLSAQKEGRPVSTLIYNDGKGWTLQYPPSPSPSKVRQSSIESLIRDIRDWRVREFLTEVPKGLDSKFTFRLILRYRKVGSNKDEDFIIDVLGRKGYSEYIVQLLDASLREVTSVYLADLLEPFKNLVEPNRK